MNSYRVTFLSELKCQCHVLMPRVLMQSSFIFSSTDYTGFFAFNSCVGFSEACPWGKDMCINLLSQAM